MSMATSENLQPKISPTKEYSLFGQSEVHKELSALKKMQIEGFNARINEKLEALDRVSLIDLVKAIRAAFPLVDKKIKDKIALYPSCTEVTQTFVSQVVSSNLTPAKTGGADSDGQQKHGSGASDCAVLEQKLAVQKQRFNTIIGELTTVENYFKGTGTVDKPLKTITLKTIYNNHLKMISERDQQIASLNSQISSLPFQTNPREEPAPEEDVLAKFRVEKDTLRIEAAALKSKLFQSEAKCGILEKSISELKVQLEEAARSGQVKIDALIKSEAALTQEIEKIKSDVESSSNLSKIETSKLKSELEHAKSRALHLEGQLSSLNAELKEKESQLLAGQSKETKPEKIVPELDKLCEELKAKQAELEDQLVAERSAHLEKLKDADQKAKITQEKLDMLKPMNKKLKEEIATLKALVKSQEDELKDLQSKISQVNPNEGPAEVTGDRQIEELNEKLQRAEESKGCLYKELKALKDRFDQLGGEHDQAKSKLEATIQKSADHATNFKALETELAASKTRESKLGDQFEESQAKVKDLEQVVSQNSAKIIEGINKAKTLEKQVADLKAEGKHKDNQITKLEKEGQHLQNEYSQAERLLKSMKEEFETLDSKHSECSNQLDAQRQEFDSFITRHQSCQPKSSEIFCGNCANLQAELTKALSRMQEKPKQSEDFSLSTAAELTSTKLELNTMKLSIEKLKIDLIKAKKASDSQAKIAADLQRELELAKTKATTGVDDTLFKRQLTDILSTSIDNIVDSDDIVDVIIE